MESREGAGAGGEEEEQKKCGERLVPRRGAQGDALAREGRSAPHRWQLEEGERAARTGASVRLRLGEPQGRSALGRTPRPSRDDSERGCLANPRAPNFTNSGAGSCASPTHGDFYWAAGIGFPVAPPPATHGPSGHYTIDRSSWELPPTAPVGSWDWAFKTMV